MTVAHACLLVSALLPIVCAGLSKAGLRGYDNRNPRDWLASQQGWRKRAVAAQANSWEAFTVFAAAVLTAVQTGAPAARIDLLAVVFVVARVAYIACYVADRPTLRSLVWSVGFGASIASFVASTW